MDTAIYNGWYVRTNEKIGPWTTTTTQLPSEYQIHNAYRVRTALQNFGFSESAIVGIIGNMQHESTLDPALIEETNRWRLPNSAANLSDVPNSVMENHYKEYYTGQSGSGGYGIGLVQWDGKGITKQKLVGYCENNNYVWYDGNAQMQRILYERTNNMQWVPDNMWGVLWTWDNFVTNTMTPEQSADIWCQCYERSGGFPEREGNARYWHQYFIDHPHPPMPVWMMNHFRRECKLCQTLPLT